MGLRESILAVQDLPREQVEVPEWGNGTPLVVWLRCLTAAERDQYETQVLSKRDKVANVRARLLVMSLVDGAGTRLFQDSDLESLAAKSGIVVDRLFWKALAISGMTKADAKELGGN